MKILTKTANKVLKQNFKILKKKNRNEASTSQPQTNFTNVNANDLVSDVLDEVQLDLKGELTESTIFEQNQQLHTYQLTRDRVRRTIRLPTRYEEVESINYTFICLKNVHTVEPSTL